MMHSVCTTFGAKGILLEPDEIARPPIPADPRWSFDLMRCTSIAEDFSRSWMNDYMLTAAETINKIKPDILILFGSGAFPTLLILRHKPKKIMYHATEFISAANPRSIKAHRVAMHSVDLMTAPEVNRLNIDLENLGTKPQHIAPIMNCADVAQPNPILKKSADRRNGHFLFYGTLDRQRAFANYFWHPLIRPFKLDISGRIADRDPDAVMLGLQSNPNCRYLGVLSAQQLNAHRQDCAWSLVWWNPEVNAGAYYLCSNRFFTSIQAGLPPICGPHPQCVTFVERYDCGLIMKDWSVESLQATMNYAASIYGTPRYAELVANCARASQDLNWATQYSQIEPTILETLSAA